MTSKSAFAADDPDGADDGGGGGGEFICRVLYGDDARREVASGVSENALSTAPKSADDDANSILSRESVA